jgi:hypothetical protein
MPLDATGFAITETQLDRDLAVLRAARDGIARPGGWCQHSYTDGRAHCAVGWIAEALGLRWHNRLTRKFSERIFLPILPTSCLRLQDYNDAASEQMEIAYLFDRAIARLEAQRTDT